MAAMEFEMVKAVKAAGAVVMVILHKNLVLNQGGTEQSEIFTAGVMELATIWAQNDAIHYQVIKTTQLSKIV